MQSENGSKPVRQTRYVRNPETWSVVVSAGHGAWSDGSVIEELNKDIIPSEKGSFDQVICPLTNVNVQGQLLKD